MPARNHLRRGAGGFVLVRDYAQLRDGEESFGGHGVIWWDAKAEQYVQRWWDSMGGAPSEFRGGFEGGVLVLIDRSERGWTRGRMVLEGNTLRHVLEMSKDGESWTELMRGEYRRTD